MSICEQEEPLQEDLILPNTHMSPNRSKNTSYSGVSKHRPKGSIGSSAKHSEILIYQTNTHQSPSDALEETSEVAKSFQEDDKAALHHQIKIVSLDD